MLLARSRCRPGALAGVWEAVRGRAGERAARRKGFGPTVSVSSGWLEDCRGWMATGWERLWFVG